MGVCYGSVGQHCSPTQTDVLPTSAELFLSVPSPDRAFAAQWGAWHPCPSRQSDASTGTTTTDFDGASPLLSACTRLRSSTLLRASPGNRRAH